jgi:hypothetical protein
MTVAELIHKLQALGPSAEHLVVQTWPHNGRGWLVVSQAFNDEDRVVLFFKSADD